MPSLYSLIHRIFDVLKLVVIGKTIVTEYSLSLPPPDPSLTPANILQVTHRIPLWGGGASYYDLNMPMSQHKEIVGKFDDDEEAKQELITTWLAGHPCPSWEHVMRLLRGGVGGEEGERAAREVEETYIKSELLNYCLLKST